MRATDKTERPSEVDRARITRFEDLVAWQKARQLTRLVYLATCQGSLAKDAGLSHQMQRAAVSVMSNIAEGFERGGRGEFHQFLSTAKASCAELRSQLYIALDVGYLDAPRFQQLMATAEEVARIVGGLRAAVERQRKEPSFGSKLTVTGTEPPARDSKSTDETSLDAPPSVPISPSSLLSKGCNDLRASALAIVRFSSA